ncbi:EAL domain-containing protein [Halomonas koreensis]|uniref:EAL domain-containing protein n=1 Tax=Halomonas koreensis TaxID=245385 RepID=A0ABU1G2P4_9GAMM|nr:EAL domain-containing protein [Halomonas koreensis]MDR5866704.1 EAL domain-containing protein [Halomonas koreensis]
MRVWRFSRLVLALLLALLAVVSLILLSAAYLGAREALWEGAEQAHRQNQRILERVISTHFEGIQRQSESIADEARLVAALGEAPPARLQGVLREMLGELHGEQVDALVVSGEDGRALASVSLLGTPLPLGELSRAPGPLATWTSLEAQHQGRPYNLLRLSLPIVEPTLGRVIGRLHSFVVLDDSFWITNALQGLFGARATTLSLDGRLLDARLADGRAPRLPVPERPVMLTDEGVFHSHPLRIGDSDVYRVGLLLPDDGLLALRNTQVASLLYATLLVVAAGVGMMLVLRRFTARSLDSLVRYAEAVPESGRPRPFRGGRFREFNRVGKAFETMLERIRERDKYLEGIIQHAPDLIFVKDLAGRYRLVNRRYAWALGTTPDALDGVAVDEALDEEVMARATRSDDELLERQGPVTYHATLHTPDGARRYRITKFPILDDAGRPYLIGGVATDITDLRQVQDQLELTHQVFAETDEAIAVLDDRHRAQMTNRAFAELSGREGGRDTAAIRDFLLHHPEVTHALTEGQRWQGQCEFPRGDGEGLPVLVSATTLSSDRQGRRRHMLLFSDITALKVAEQRLERLAWYDALTGLANRSLFALRLEEALQAEDGAATAVVFVDLDRFKDINDTHGHSLGDELLCRVADRLRSCVQPRDTVARFGGDEFVIMLRGLSREDLVMSVARRILRVLGEPYDLGVLCCFATASLGISLAARHGRTSEALLRCADQAMYEAKARGRERVLIFDPDIDERHRLRLRYEASLRQALANDELYVLYQPRFDIAGRRVVGAEALLRWESPTHGSVPPGTFIPIAENSGLIVELGRFVLEAACREAAAWGEASRAVPVSVNLSPRQLHEPDLIRDIQAALADAGLAPHRLELEITETHLMDNVDQMLPVLHQIRAMGVGLAIDDFGTGYSSLTYLKRLPIELLKIDRGFLADVPGDADDEALLEAIIHMAHRLGFRVVAEGVETERQRRFLADLGCDELQGFLLGRPQRGARLRAELDRDRRASPPRS